MPWTESIAPRLLLVAAITGIACGLLCVGLRFALWFLQWGLTGHFGLLASAASTLPLWRRALTPVLGALAASLILKWADTFQRQKKFAEYVAAVRFHDGRIPFLSTSWKTLSSAFSVASGAAVGREGSMIQFAAAATSAWGQRWKPGSLSLQKLVALGSAAAVASVYQAPLAGAFFALEIVLGTAVLSRSALQEVPALLTSAAAGGLMSHYLLGSGPLFAVGVPVRFGWEDGLPLLIGAVAIGALGPAYYYVIKSGRFLKGWPFAMVWSGAVVGILSCLQPEVWGNGDSGVLAVVKSQFTWETALLLLALRLVATAACVGSGVIGGVFTPTVLAGSVLGLLFGTGLHSLVPGASTPVGYAVVGIGCLLASVTHAPLMASFMSVELTGTPEWFPVVLLASFISWTVAKKITPHSLYAIATPNPTEAVEDNDNKGRGRFTIASKSLPQTRRGGA